MAAKIRILVNGENSDKISVTDRGLQFGDGVFETIRVFEGRAIWWQSHLSRLLEGCRHLHFTHLPNTERLQQEADFLISTCASGVLKIIITRGCSNSGYATSDSLQPNRILSLTPGLRHHSKAEQGIHLGICQQRLANGKLLAGVKHLNRLEQVLGRLQCQQKGWDEGVMLDYRDRVIEGSMSNLFIWHDEHLLTPSLENAGIRGLCRKKVIDMSEKAGIKLSRSTLKLEDLTAASAMFVTNSLIGIWPVAKFNNQALTINDSTRQLQRVLEESICLAE